jgi:hypothetical protein
MMDVFTALLFFVAVMLQDRRIWLMLMIDV